MKQIYVDDIPWNITGVKSAGFFPVLGCMGETNCSQRLNAVVPTPRPCVQPLPAMDLEKTHCDQYPPVSSNMVSWEIHEVNGGLKLGKSMINRRLFQLATSDYPRASIYKWVSFYCCVWLPKATATLLGGRLLPSWKSSTSSIFWADALQAP